MKKRAKIFISIIVVVLGVLIFGTVHTIGEEVFISSVDLTNKTKSVTGRGQYFNRINFSLDTFEEAYQIEEVMIESTYHDHNITADYITIEDDKNHDTMILVHGMGEDRKGTYPIAEIFLEAGYNVFCYDQRNAGDNTAVYSTYGYLESHDLADCVKYVSEFIDEDKTFGVWGLSWGGGTVGYYIGSDDFISEVDFAILDCPVGAMEDFIRREMEKMNMDIPIDLMLWCGSVKTKAELGFTYDDAYLYKYMDNVSIPVFIINSTRDTVTPISIGDRIFENIPHENKMRFIVEDSKHANIYHDHEEDYKEMIFKFIEMYKQ
jgi:alpha-beta hydrolase superfamily lysophospholipase